MDKDEKLKLEYETANNSAQHYNNMIWTLIGGGVLLSLIIIYLVLKGEIKDLSVVKALLLFGFIILLYFNFVIEKSNKIKNNMYNICQKLEDDLKFKYKPNKEVNELFKKSFLKGIYLFRLIIIALFGSYIIVLGNVYFIEISVFLALVISVILDFLIWLLVK